MTDPGGNWSWAKVPASVTRHRQLPDAAKVLYAELLILRGRNPDIRGLRLVDIGHALGWSASKVKNAMRHLVAAGLVTPTRGLYGDANTYVIHEPDTARPDLREAGTGPTVGSDLTPRRGQNQPHSGVRSDPSARATPSLEREVLEGERRASAQEPPPSHIDKPNPEPRPPLYQGRCPTHGNDHAPPHCGACADARRTHQAAESEREQRSRAERPDVTCPNPDHAWRLFPAGTECPGCRVDRISAPDPDDAIPAPRIGPPVGGIRTLIAQLAAASHERDKEAIS